VAAPSLPPEKGKEKPLTIPTTKMIPKLRAVPGAHALQMGDGEAALWLAADDLYAIKVVGGRREMLLTV